MTMKLLPVPFAPGIDQSTDPAFMPPGALVHAENVRPVKGGRLAKRPAGAVRNYSTSGAVQMVASSGSHNLIGLAGQLFVEDGNQTTIGYAGQLPHAKPVGMWDTQHSGAIEIAADTPDVEAGRASAITGAGRTVVAYEYAEGVGVSTVVWVRGRVLDRGSRRTVQDLRIAGSAPMVTAIPTQTFSRLFYVNGAASAVVWRDVTPASGAPIGAESGTTISVAPSTVRVFSVGTRAGLATYFVAVLMADGTLRLYRRVASSGAADSGTAQVDVATGVSVDARVDVAVSGDRVFVVWAWASGVRVRAYSHNLTTFVGSAVTANEVSGQSNHRQPFIMFDDAASVARLVWSCDDTARGPDTLNYLTANATGAVSAVTRDIEGLRPLSRPLIRDGGVYITAGQRETPAPNRYRLFHLTQEGNAWRAYSQLQFEGEAHIASDNLPAGEQPADILPVGSRFIWVQRTRYRGFEGEIQTAVREWEFELSRAVQLQVVDADGVPLLPAGELTYYDGASVADVGFPTPRIQALAPFLGGTIPLTPGRYIYSIAYERVDASGRLRLGPPALPVTGNLGGNGGFDLTLFAPPQRTQRTPFVAHLYRSLPDGTVLYRATNMRRGLSGPTYPDRTNNTTLATRPVLYTEGGVLPYDPPPASSFGARALGRVWLGGLFLRERIVCSTDLAPGEVPGFPLDPSHWLDFPEPVTGLGELDSDLVVFGRRDVWLVTGSGPTRTGAGGFETRRISADLGCIDWRSVLSTSIGVFFASQAGIMLVPRGMSPPVYVGRAIADEWAARPHVVSAAVHGEGDSAVARFVLADSATAPTSTRVLAFSLRAQAWSVDTLAFPSVPRHLGTFLDAASGGRAAVIAGGDLTGGVLVEAPGASSATYVPGVLRTGEIAPFGFGARFRVHRIWLRGIYRGPCTLRLSALHESQTVATESVDWDLTGLTVGEIIRREWRPRHQECTSLRLELQDTSNGSAGSSGVDYLGLVLEVSPEGPQNLQTAERS
jgi:hypothetical protein